MHATEKQDVKYRLVGLQKTFGHTTHIPIHIRDDIGYKSIVGHYLELTKNHKWRTLERFDMNDTQSVVLSL
jgi:hypothetical protein